jgi:hypothetical protein
MFRTPYRARYFRWVSFVGALWQPSFSNTGFVVGAAGAADSADPLPSASAATLDDERNCRLFMG